jgi:hypothetical protein
MYYFAVFPTSIVYKSAVLFLVQVENGNISR